MAKKIIYEEHPREYTILGASAISDEFVSERYRKFLGAGFSEMIAVVRNGQYYHIQQAGEWEKIGRAFLRRVNQGSVNLKRELAEFQKDMAGFRRFIRLNQEEYSLNTIKEFYSCYCKVSAMGCVGYSTVDYIDELILSRKKFYRAWAEKVRLLGEDIFKVAEIERRTADWPES